jgi:hypothetical protein
MGEASGHLACWLAGLSPRYSLAATLRCRRVDEIDTEAVLAVLKPIWIEKPETYTRLVVSHSDHFASHRVEMPRFDRSCGPAIGWCGYGVGSSQASAVICPSESRARTADWHPPPKRVGKSLGDG